jgi:tripartite-type tricarboxylate transporter receptor subunit TctC
MRRRTTLGLLGGTGTAAVALALPGAAPRAQQDYPTRPVRFVVPFAAGSATDAVARLLGQRVSAVLGQPAVVENVAGASGVLAAQAVARAAPDGHTVLITTNTTHGANQSLLAHVPYDAVADFAPVARLGTSSLILVVSPSLGARSLAELAERARAEPGRLTFGSGSSSSRVSGEMLRVRAGMEIVHVPYRSIPPAVLDVLAGQISMAWADIQSSLPHVQAGRLRALAVSGPARIALAPDIPTAAEAGVPGFDITAWYGAFAPARTPAPILVRLHAAFAAALGDPETVARLHALGVEPAPSTPEELGSFVVAEIAKWAAIVRAAGIQPE